jgi:hypothetical protein
MTAVAPCETTAGMEERSRWLVSRMWASPACSAAKSSSAEATCLTSRPPSPRRRPRRAFPASPMRLLPPLMTCRGLGCSCMCGRWHGRLRTATHTSRQHDATAVLLSFRCGRTVRSSAAVAVAGASCEVTGAQLLAGILVLGCTALVLGCTERWRFLAEHTVAVTESKSTRVTKASAIFIKFAPPDCQVMAVTTRGGPMLTTPR